MDKPISLSVKHFIIRNMSVMMKHQESLIETVINHQMESAHEALDKHYSLEFSGFGKFYFNMGKAKKRMEKIESQIETFNKLLETELTPVRRRNIEMKLQSVEKNKEYLKKKIDGRE